MKLIYLAFARAQDIGVFNKIKYQSKVFNKNFDTYVTCLNNDYDCLYIYNKDSLKYKISKDKFFIDVIARRKSYYKELYKFIKEDKIRFIYIRYNLSDVFFIDFLKKINKLDIKIFIEIPTFPYNEELNFISRLVDGCYTNKLKRYVDKIITYSDDKEIYDIQTINIQNGIDVDCINLKKELAFDDTLNLIGVATLCFWHGYDRVIEGLYNYYKKDNKIKVYFNIVGEGLMLQSLKEQVANLNLSKYVIFHGFKSGNKLDEIFDNSHLAVGSIANFRKSIFADSALKSREYCARGIPFIIASKDDDFLKEFQYVFKVDENNKPINILDIITFYNNILNFDFKTIMRKYAEQHLTWEIKMKKIVEYIKIEEGKING